MYVLTGSAGQQRVGQSDTSTDYLLYIRRGRRALALALLSSLAFLALYAFRTISDFRDSSSNGNNSILILILVLCLMAVLVGLFAVGIFVPALLRVLVLRHRMPHASFYVVKRIPKFWDRLTAVNPRRSISSPMQNAVLSVDAGSASIWRGVFRPKKVAVLPLGALSQIECNRTGVTPFRRRIMVLTFTIDENLVELPLALRTLSSLGYGRLNKAQEKQVVAKIGLLAK